MAAELESGVGNTEQRVREVEAVGGGGRPRFHPIIVGVMPPPPPGDGGPALPSIGPDRAGEPANAGDGGAPGEPGAGGRAALRKGGRLSTAGIEGIDRGDEECGGRKGGGGGGGGVPGVPGRAHGSGGGGGEGDAVPA